MEQMNYNQADLAKELDLKNIIGDILSKKQKLTLEIIRKLHEKLNIPTDGLIQAY